MESDVFFSYEVYNIFADEYLFHNKGNTTWNEFLEFKNLGIVSLGLNSFRIQDKKKWLLSKLKYGF